MKNLLVEFFDTTVPLSAGVEEYFFVRYEDVLRPKRLSDAHFQMLVFFKGNQYFLFTSLVARIICFIYWFRIVT